ncbi:FKBP-type peptidyl-prolyl cis-trans isomerase [Mucilaginibacter terrae]|uniref:FKBP-type peptidyl-prolyl cis-trans isomerase n=1 Tax=Mucilaginibacter terrae TaxID=1955052 RepID=UPI00363C20E0
MKQIYFALILLLTMGIVSCRKSGNDVDIKTYDQQQIDAYIKANNLANMKRDVTDGDTSGIYYEILSQGYGAGNELNYETPASLVYSIKSLDGNYVVSDTILNHSYNYVGTTTPKGLMIALHNLAKFKGTRAKFIIPSRLAYGPSGSGTGPGRLTGNQSLEYYVNVINNQNLYDDQVITKYLAANNLAGYTRIPSGEYEGLYYKVTQQGTGTDIIKPTSTITVQYTGRHLNGPYLNQTIFDQANTETGASFILEGTIQGWVGGLQKVTAGGKLSLFIPSKLGYGTNAQTDQNTGLVSIPANSVLHFELNILTVTN